MSTSRTEAVLADLDQITDWQEELYRQLHRNPELSMQESETVAEIARRLTAFGYDVTEIGGGVVGVLHNGDGPTVLFRADIDALPVKEATGLPYASTKTAVDAEGSTVPVMHACGHDMHVAAALGAAALLAEHRDAWSGTYEVLFQPGEETAAGAHSMVDAGLVDSTCSPARRPVRWAPRSVRSCRPERACGSRSTGRAATARCRTSA